MQGRVCKCQSQIAILKQSISRGICYSKKRLRIRKNAKEDNLLILSTRSINIMKSLSKSSTCGCEHVTSLYSQIVS